MRRAKPYFSMLILLLPACVGCVASNSVAAPEPIKVLDKPLQFSNELSAYPSHPTARSRTVEEIYQRTATPGINLSDEYVSKRKEIIQMYKNSGIDLSLEKEELAKIAPKTWSKKTPQPLSGKYLQPYSVDSPFYKQIPAKSPRVQLPNGYFKSGHISTLGPPGDGSDGFGIGVVISGSNDPMRTIHLQKADGYAKIGTCPDHNPFKDTNVNIRIRNSANVKLGERGEGVPSNRSDRTVVWVNGADNTVVSTWGTIEDCTKPAYTDKDGKTWEATKAGDWSAMYIPRPEKLPSLGDSGGINAANKSDLVALIRPGEATNPKSSIPHALSGPVRDAWKAIVYPARNYDNSIDSNNRGLLGYGFLVQLDPTLNLSELKLSLPARRVLEAIQTYGWYMDDTGVRDFDIKGNFSAAEVNSYGGVGAVDAEVIGVINKNKMYVVPPLVKK